MPNQHTSGTYGMSTPERFFSYVDFTDTCWLWTGGIDKDGYGKFWWHGQTGRAHRWVYGFCVGPIPDGLQIDHLCRVPRCVNPDHLEAVTGRVNVMRSPIAPAAINARKTHCQRGHPFDEANTYVNPLGQRECRICGRIKGKRHYWRRKKQRRLNARS